ncbi:MAG TPA: carbon-nitrogen hydrolase family protein [Planctomycetota bacterium]
MRIALIHQVFPGPDGAERLAACLQRAAADGATLAVLPEIACNPWSPATRVARAEDAEPPDGLRHGLQAAAARAAGIALVGAAIVQDSATGRRENTALVFDARGTLQSSFAKLHVPEEPGFWETDHYEPGREAAPLVRGLGLPFGVQICSDMNRPMGAHALAARGAELIVNPRSTERATYAWWRMGFQMTARTTCTFVVSVNRPAAEFGVEIGGPSIAVAPDGEVLLETEEPLAIVDLDPARLVTARAAYPGYLPVRSDLYARDFAAATAPLAEARP